MKVKDWTKEGAVLHTYERKEEHKKENNITSFSRGGGRM